MTMRSFVCAVVLLSALAGCSFDPNIPSGSLLCDTRNPDCPRGYSCEMVELAANRRTAACCSKPGCTELSTDDRNRIIGVALDRARDAGTDSPPGIDAGGDKGGPTPTPDTGPPPPVCGNRSVETGETCDPGDSCPTACPPIGCTLQKLEGSARTCDARCVASGTQSACVSGDSCCPMGCTTANDSDCSCACGNGVTEAACGETCDPQSSCPTTCPPMGCQLRRLVNMGTCQAQCVDAGTETQCVNGDGCCPPSCNSTNDNDCSPKCGNGVREADEKCDGDDCPQSCPAMGCQRRKLQGSAAQCNAECVDDDVIMGCMGGDSCCASGCSSISDSDCMCQCGNGVPEPACGEKCDGPNCPTACPAMGCQLRALRGSACTRECVNTSTITACANGDGCCPPGCNRNNDNNCQPACGNGAVEPGEVCDPVSACQAQSDLCVSDRNTIRTRAGNPNSCTFRCTSTPRPCSGTPDGQCPTSCGPGQDADCKLPNGSACTAPAQCSSGACTTFFKDMDGDGKGGAEVKVCGSTPPDGTITLGGDCCDTDPKAFPGQPLYFATPSNCGNYDYNCSGGAEREHPSIQFECSDRCISGWMGQPPACGVSGTFRTCQSPTGPACLSTTEMLTQRCR
jgi:hypothetical protein